ncbi:transposase [Herbaspirillum sp. GCM10030257]|uniref:transposase n=1 Tax=Herbaspirillum sp. GCM10030257 TaxID=3273393 RepID=UPI0036117912
MLSGRQNEVEVTTEVQRRRRWTSEQKLEWVKKTMESGISVSLVAREAGIINSHPHYLNLMENRYVFHGTST